MECFLVDARLSSLGVSEIYCAECTWSLVVKKKINHVCKLLKHHLKTMNKANELLFGKLFL